MKILIVEDETIAARYLKEMLLEAGYEVVGSVGTGKGAIELAKLKKPDLILMDIMLKDAISGVDAAIQIQNQNQNIMIVFLTAYSDKEMIDAAIDANAFGYFLKPYNRDEILANLTLLEAKQKSYTTKDSSLTENQDITLIHGYHYSLQNKQLYLNQAIVKLSKREHQIIDYMCRNLHVVIDFNTLMYAIWGTKIPQQTLRSLIYRIREKTSHDLIVSINKMGYILVLKEKN